MGFSGVLLRSTGALWDLRKETPYEIYDKIKFKIPVGKTGDCYDRYLIRIEEMRQSIFIIQQVLNLLPDGLVSSQTHLYKKVAVNSQTYMEEVIQHFKSSVSGFNVPAGVTYSSAETPKGELGVLLVSDNSKKPYRCKIRSPGFIHLQGMDLMSKNHMLADVVTLIGTQDIVFGEVDR
jgi:NADH-quinone oxidoreductase subunit D